MGDFVVLLDAASIVDGVCTVDNCMYMRLRRHILCDLLITHADTR